MKRVSSKQERQRRFLADYVECGANKLLAAERCKVSESTVHRWFREDDDFREKVRDLHSSFEQPLFEEAMRRALSGSDTMLIFMLKSVNPERYCESTRRARYQSIEASKVNTERPQIIQFVGHPDDAKEPPFKPYDPRKSANKSNESLS